VHEARLAPVMQALLDHREALLLRPEEYGLTDRRKPGGPTDLYNLFDDPQESSSPILRLRELHRELLARILEAYGWTDLEPDWDFDHPWIDGTWRYVPSHTTRRHLVVRLAELSGQRRREDLNLYLGRLMPLVRSRKTVKQLLQDAASAGIRIGEEDLVEVLELARARGLVVFDGGKAWPCEVNRA